MDREQTLEVAGKSYRYAPLDQESCARLPLTLKILLENVLRNLEREGVEQAHVDAFAEWLQQGGSSDREIPFSPARVLMQDFTGVPAIVDLAAMRDVVQDAGKDPAKINPQVDVDLVIDHSVTVDYFASDEAYRKNTELEMERNAERYRLLRWAQGAFNRLRVVPPGTGICHQVNLEYLAKVVWQEDGVAYPDTLVGTDSHTTMINALGVLGWGVGGIEAEAAMLGQPISLRLPEVVGFEFTGKLNVGVTATDLVLRVVEMLREAGVVGQFVEFCGAGLQDLTIADRATIANMAPEYGATCGFFPVDEQTLAYLDLTGRSAEQRELVETYAKTQGLWREEAADIHYSRRLKLDLSTVEPSVAGPKRPQDRVPISGLKSAVRDLGAAGKPTEAGAERPLRDGDVVIAAITSCTNTSNPAIMIGAGLLAKNAVARGLKRPDWVKTSLAPGSKVVSAYLERLGLQDPLDALGFQVVGYGCTTCIGNSGPLPPEVDAAVREGDLTVHSVLSGNRNFEGRIHPHVRGNWLASPPLVVAFALAGRIDIDLTSEPLGQDADGNDVFLKDIWPTPEAIGEAMQRIDRELFAENYAEVYEGPEAWRSIQVQSSVCYPWDDQSTYIRKPPFILAPDEDLPAPADIEGARVLALLGDSITTDHISPAGAIAPDSPAGQYLQEHGVEVADFNSYGARRGNHEVMMRGTFANVRLQNLLTPEKRGGWSVHLPDNQEQPLYDVAMRYQEEGVPAVVLAGSQYGTGSSRDWAAKGTLMLGIRAVIATSFERIHRSNLVGMGVLPVELQEPAEPPAKLWLHGDETVTIRGLAGADKLQGQEVSVVIYGIDGERELPAVIRVDTPMEERYLRAGGILSYVLATLI